MHVLSVIRKSEGLQQIIFTIVGNILASAISAISLIIISRILGPTEFGVFSVGLSLAFILVKINVIGLNTALTKYAAKEDTKHKRDSLFSLALRYKIIGALLLIISGVIFLVLFDTSSLIENKRVLYLTVLLFFITVIYEHILVVLQSLRLFKEAVIAALAQAMVKCAGVVLLFISTTGSLLSFYSLYLAAPLIVSVFFKKMLGKKSSVTINETPAKKEKNEFLNLVKYSSIAVILSALIENIDILFASYYLSSYETGLLAGVSKIAMVISVVAYSLSNVLNARVARYTSKEHLRKYIQKAAIVSFCFLVGFIFFVPLAPSLIYLTVGSAYLDGLQVLLILMLCGFVGLATIPFGALFFTFKADWFFLLNAIIMLCIIFIGNILFVRDGGLAAAALVKLSAFTISYLLTIILALRQYHLEYAKT